MPAFDAMELLPPIIRREFCRVYLGSDLSRGKWIAGAAFAVLLILDALIGNGFMQAFRGFLLIAPVYQAVADGLRTGSLLLKDEFSEGELEVLLTTPLSPIQILLGKLLGQSLRGMQWLWLELPVFSFAVIFELQTPTQGLISALYCLALFAFCVILGVAVSVRLRFTINSWAIAWITFLGVATPPLLLDFFRFQLAPLPGFPTALLYWSPLHPAIAIWRGFSSGSEMDALRTLGVLAAVGILLGGWVWLRFRGVCQTQFSDEQPRQRTALRNPRQGDLQAILEENPFAWLALKDPSVTQVAVWFLVALASVVGGCSAVWGTGWITPLKSLLIGCFLVSVQSSLVHYDLCHRIAKERRQGTLELLLTSPVSPEDIFRGQIEATRHRFRKVLIFSLIVDVGLCALSLPKHSWNIHSCIVYAELWTFLLYWTMRVHRPRVLPAGFRAGLLTGNPLHTFAAGLRRQAWHYYIFVGPSGFFAFFNLLGKFPSGTLGETVLVSFGVFAIAVIAAAATQANPVAVPEWMREFRTVASTPIPSTEDARVRDWNGTGDWPPVPGLRETSELTGRP